jgi:hypothetical protein
MQNMDNRPNIIVGGGYPKNAEKMINENKKYTINDVREYLKKYFRFTRNSVTDEVFFQRLSGHSTKKPFNREFFMDYLLGKFCGVNVGQLRILLKATHFKEENPFSAFLKGGKNPTNEKQNNSPFTELDNYFSFSSDAPFTLGSMLEMHLVRAIRTLLNGDPNRFIFTLVSLPQYLGKTSFIQWLFPPTLLKYCMPTLSGRKEKVDVILARKFLVNIDDFASVKDSADDRLKAMLSQRSASLWVPFKNQIAQKPRIATFFATKNTGSKAILNANDSNSRFIIFDVNSIDWSYEQKINPTTLWQYALEKAHDPDYEANLTIEDVRELEKYNERFSKRSKPKAKKINAKTSQALALGAVLGAAATSLLATPMGRAALSFLLSLVIPK